MDCSYEEESGLQLLDKVCVGGRGSGARASP